MVYIFFVQPGDMMTFDNVISIMQSVADLKEKIKEKCNIPQEQQVLLINGGEPLDVQKNLCSYMAGTDTNPIYLFSTNYDVSKLDILRNLHYDDNDIKERLSDCLSLPVTLSTVKSRALVAQDYFSVAKFQLEFCEALVHEQHLQQQGWSAVIANLEDIVTEFRKRWDLFLKMYEDFMADRDAYDSFLCSFEDDKRILRQIPVIGILLEPMDGSKVSETTTSTSETEPSKEISLYDWISSSDSKNSLDDLYEICTSNLKKFEKEIMPSLEKQVGDTLQSAEKPERKEIEGLGKRLFDLEELLRKIKKYVEHQSDMAQSFLQNQNSVAHMKDTSILPDLCATHVQQLELIRQCHQKLMDDRHRVVRAKYELSKSLCARIGWVQNVEDKLWELDSLLVYFHEHLQRLRSHLEVFQQLHQAPVIYMTAVVEVVRRRSFSQIFLLWASDLACQQLTIYNEEVTRRKDFSSQFEGHFLNALFPGMGDVPPAFAIEAPPMFDAKLPGITEEDVEKLRKEVPDFAENLTLPDMNHVVSFFMGRLSVKGKEDKVDDAKEVEEKLIQAVSDVGLASNLDKNLLKATGSELSLVSAPGLPNLKDDKGCESETDTEEFEKVGQSPLELTFPQGVVPKATEKQDASTSTEDNLQISRSEHDTLKTMFLQLGSIAKLATTSLRSDLNGFRDKFVSETRVLSKQYEDMGSSWETLLLEVDRNEKEIVQCMRRDNESEKERYRYNLMEKEDIIRRLEEDKRAVEDRIEDAHTQLATLEEKLAQQKAESTNKIDDLLRQLHEKDLDKEKSLKELGDNLKMEHRAELDNIKGRFKLMTMERSTSLTSLEKEKSGDFASLPNHTALLLQMTENFELDIKKAVSEEQKRWEKVLEEKTKELHRKFEEDKELLRQDVAKRVSEDKDKQIDVLSEREKNLNLEIVKHKTTIQQLAEYQEVEDVDVLKMENLRLQDELEKIKSETFTLMPESCASTSRMTKSEMSPGRPQGLSIHSCKTGDVVLVMWDQAHEHFRVLQESAYACFLHSDSLQNLGLTVSEGRPNRTYCTGEVVNKDMCETRLGSTRFKVPKGSKFFLVRVKPIARLQFRQDLAQSQYTPRQAEESEAIGTIEKQLAEDSGIVDNVEQATAAIEDIVRLDEDGFFSTQQDHDRSQDTKLVELEKKSSLDGDGYKTIVAQLTTESQPSEIDVEVLRRENEQLQEELAKIRAEMSTSVAVYEGKLDATTSPLATSPPASDRLSKSEIVSSRRRRPHRLSIDSCKAGDIVLLLWDQTYENFKILQESRHTFFLNSDYRERLGLNVVDGKPNKTHCTGEVIDKEFCVTRKNVNRYKCPKGMKFFRVKVKPISSPQRDLSQSSSTSRHASAMSSSQSETATFEPLIEERKQEEDSGQSTSAQKHFAEDSGIEEATVAVESNDRCEGDSRKEAVDEQSTYVSTNWLEAMFRSMFSK